MTETILVTGASGYIAKNIVAGLLERGHSVIGSARTQERDAEIRAAVGPALSDQSKLKQYRTVALDLGSDAGWSDAISEATVLFHTASPFPLTQPKNEQEVIEPAVQGAVRALKTATEAGVKRVIFTSSSAAITIKDRPSNGSAYTEDDWTDLSHPVATPYYKSKTLAERAAWEFAETAPDLEMTVINPTFVQGPPLDKNYGTSTRVLERLLRGKDPMVPRFGFPVVDVRDVAEAHIRAMERPDTVGERLLLADRFMWFSEMAKVVKEALPHRKIPTREAPDFVIRMLSLFDAEARTIVPALGRKEVVSSEKAQNLLDMTFRDAGAAVRETAVWLDENRVV